MMRTYHIKSTLKASTAQAKRASSRYKVVGRLMTITDDPNTFKKIIEETSMNYKSVVAYKPRSFDMSNISNVQYIMDGYYPNIQSIEYLGTMASFYKGNVKIQNRKPISNYEDIGKLEAKLMSLTGLSNMSISEFPAQSLKEVINGLHPEDILAVSMRCEGIFEKKIYTWDEINNIIPFLVNPVLIL